MVVALQRSPNLFTEEKPLDHFHPDTPIGIVRDYLLELGMPESSANLLWQDHYGEFHAPGYHPFGPSPTTTDARWGKFRVNRVELQVSRLAVLVKVPDELLNFSFPGLL